MATPSRTIFACGSVWRFTRDSLLGHWINSLMLNSFNLGFKFYQTVMNRFNGFKFNRRRPVWCPATSQSSRASQKGVFQAIKLYIIISESSYFKKSQAEHFPSKFQADVLQHMTVLWVLNFTWAIGERKTTGFPPILTLQASQKCAQNGSFSLSMLFNLKTSNATRWCS